MQRNVDEMDKMEVQVYRAAQSQDAQVSREIDSVAGSKKEKVVYLFVSKYKIDMENRAILLSPSEIPFPDHKNTY